MPQNSFKQAKYCLSKCVIKCHYFWMKSLMVSSACPSPCTLLNFWNPDHVWIMLARFWRFDSTWVKCRSLLKQNWEWARARGLKLGKEGARCEPRPPLLRGCCCCLCFYASSTQCSSSSASLRFLSFSRQKEARASLVVTTGSSMQHYCTFPKLILGWVKYTKGFLAPCKSSMK